MKTGVEKIVKIIKKGGIIICPTDTVYGLICDSKNSAAIERIFKIKKRKKTKPLLLFVKDIKAAKKIAHIDENQEKFLMENWPGRITAILKSKKNLPKIISKNGTVGIRVPDHKLLKSILKEFKGPLAQTSANISGKPASIKIEEVLKQFAKNKIKPDIVIDAGNLSENRPSKIINLTKEKIKILRK